MRTYYSPAEYGASSPSSTTTAVRSGAIRRRSCPPTSPGQPLTGPQCGRAQTCHSATGENSSCSTAPRMMRPGSWRSSPPSACSMSNSRSWTSQFRGLDLFLSDVLPRFTRRDTTRVGKGTRRDTPDIRHDWDLLVIAAEAAVWSGKQADALRSARRERHHGVGEQGGIRAASIEQAGAVHSALSHGGHLWRDACLRVRRYRHRRRAPRPFPPAAPNGHADLHASTPGRGACDRASSTADTSSTCGMAPPISRGRTQRSSISRNCGHPADALGRRPRTGPDDHTAFSALNIPVGKVLASEYCRTKETAMLAFGRLTPEPKLPWAAKTGRRTAKS